MTPYEYKLRTQAADLKEINEERRLYANALATRIFTATDDKGEKFIFNDIKDLYDFEDLERQVKGEVSPEKVQKRNELEENARRLEQAKKIIEERRKKRGGE